MTTRIKDYLLWLLSRSSEAHWIYLLQSILEESDLDFTIGAIPVDYNLQTFEFNMTLEELVGCNITDKKMETVSQALEELLVAAQRQDCLTVGVYESAKLMNVDPDSVVLCVLATDEEDEDDIALQIHFTLIQAFCCDNDINILRVSGLRRLAQVLCEPSTADNNGNEPKDLHCILVTNPQCQPFKCQALQDVGTYCKESRCKNQWVPYLSLQER